LASSVSDTSKISDVQQNARHMAYMWGHDTLEDKAARKKKIEDSKVIRWTDPESNVELKRNTFYAPVRMEREERAMDSGYDSGRFNLADWYQFARYPYHARFTDPAFWYTQQQIKKYERLLRGQPFIKERLVILGPDLAAAHFLCHRNCRVKFKGRDEWTELDKRDFRLPSYVPQEYETGWYIEEIDARNSLLIYEGMNNLRNLMYIKRLDLAYSPMIDAWCVDRITGEYQDSLEYLDVSGCKKLNWNGLECLWRLRKLKVLVLQDMEHIKDLDLLCLMLLEILPDLQIRGVDYMANAPTLLKDTEHESLLSELDKSLLLLTDGIQTENKSSGTPTNTSKNNEIFHSYDATEDKLNNSNNSEIQINHRVVSNP